MPDFANLSLFSNLAGTAAQTAADVRASNEAAKVYGAEAASERAAGQYNASIARRQGERLVGKIRTVAGASNLATTSGGPLALMLEAAKQAELDALAAQYESESRARDLSMRGQYAKRGAGSAIAQGVVRGGTYFSDWYNRYGTLPSRTKGIKSPAGLEPATQFGIPSDDLMLAEDLNYPRRPKKLQI